MNILNSSRYLFSAVLLLGAASARTGHAGDWYHDATTNYLEAANWLEESHGDWHTMPWYLVGDDGDDSCCSKFAESDPLYLDGTSEKVSTEIIACRNLAGNDVQGSFHIRADLRDDCGPGFRGFALYDFHDGDRDEYPNGLREIIRFGYVDDHRLVYRVAGDEEYTEVDDKLLDNADDGKPYEIGVDFNLSWVQLEEGVWPNNKDGFRFSLMDGYRDHNAPEEDNWVPYRFDVRFNEDDWEVNAIGLIASKDTKILFSSVYVDSRDGAIPRDLRAPDPYDPGTPLPVRYKWQEEDGVYSIGSLDQLENFEIMLQDHSFPYSTFTLISDIDCEGRDFFPEGLREFAGTFDGQGHVISNLVVDAEGGDHAGLFGRLTGTVTNVMLVNPVVKGGNYVGALAGEITEGGHVGRCGVIGADVSASGNFSGAFAGRIDEGSVLAGCFVSGTVASTGDCVGGFAGMVRDSAILDSYAVADVSGNRYVGSFAGRIVNPETSLERCYAAGTASGKRDAGGFAGGLDSSPGLADCFVQDPAVATDGVKALDAAGMRAAINFAAFQATGYWTQTDGLTQPLLEWSAEDIPLTVSTFTDGNGRGHVVVSADSFAPGSMVTVTAEKDYGDTFFFAWTGGAPYADPTSPSTTFVLDNHRVASARFGKLVRTPPELRAVTNDLSGIYALDLDIDLAGRDFTPIGNAEHRFTGEFYGRGHFITNLVVTNDPAIQGRGLFGGTRGATLDGITVYGTVSGTAYFAGGLVGAADGTLVTNCHAFCTVSNASFHTGGLIGAIAEGTVVADCSATATVISPTNNAGGLVGSCGSGTVAIRDSVAVAEVTAGEYAGGFVGYVNSDRADITGCRADGYAAGNGNVGGFVGCIGGSGTVAVSGCVARVDVRSSNINYGGFIGWANDTFATVSDSWCSGAVWGTGGNIGAFVGLSQTGRIANCSFCAYGPGPRYFSGSNTNLAGGVLSVGQVRQIAASNDWPAVKKHIATAIPIANADDLLAVADAPDGCYVLVDDIDFHGQTIEPIGSADAPFTGEFYGQGHRISRYTVETTEPYAGLFGNIAGGRVNGVLAEEGAVSRLQDTNATVGVGGFAGVIQSKSLVDDCSFTGKVSNQACGKNGGFGGFVGRTDDLPAILRCGADVEAVDNVSGQPNTGGFVGDHGHGYIVDAYANGPVSGLTNCVGGFAGYVGSAARIATSWCSGQVESQGSYLGAFVGQLHVDGLVTNSCYDNNPNSGMRAQGSASAGGSVPNAGISGVDDMSDPDSFPDFDFDAIWTIDENSGMLGFFRGEQTVTFDSAGAPCVIGIQECNIGGFYEYLPEPVWPNHAFLGWFDDLGILVTPDSTVTTDTNRTFQAQWTTDQTVTFDPNGGRCDMPTAVYAMGEPYGFLPAATLEDMVLLGWFDVDECVTTDTIVPDQATRTLVAQWAPGTYTISWDTDGDGTVDDTTTVAYGETPIHADGSKVPDAQYTYTFTGWSPEPGVVTGAITYTAQFDSKVNPYDVTFTWHGGSSVESYDYGTAGTNVVVPSNPATYVEGGTMYTFTGWNPPTVADVTGAATYTAQYRDSTAEFECGAATLDATNGVLSITVSVPAGCTAQMLYIDELSTEPIKWGVLDSFENTTGASVSREFTDPSGPEGPVRVYRTKLTGPNPDDIRVKDSVVDGGIDGHAGGLSGPEEGAPMRGGTPQWP